MFLAVFGGMEGCPARRAQENSPAIYRWASADRFEVPSGRKNSRLASAKGEADFCRPGGTGTPPPVHPSDESLGWLFSFALRAGQPRINTESSEKSARFLRTPSFRKAGTCNFPRAG